MNRPCLATIIFLVLWTSFSGFAQPFQFPTANTNLLKSGMEAQFFVGTTGHSWQSGNFGCVRSNGRQMHEGIDIKCLSRDKHGEPTDPVMATAAGAVVYLNTKPALSNYGNYVVLRHVIEEFDVYSLYAHLSQIRDDLGVGQSVRAGEIIGIMGRTANTREGSSKDRAHLHFELALLINDRFADWYKQTYPTQRNDHGAWNGQNLVALDLEAILKAQAILRARFRLLDHLRRQTELCRVIVRETQFPWLQRYHLLVRRNPVAEHEGVAGYEIALNFNGLPLELVPRAKSEMPGQAKFQLVSVNEPEQQKNPCRNLVTRRKSGWELSNTGHRLLELLTY